MSEPVPSSILAIPKSMTLAIPAELMRMFCGDTSRCTTRTSEPERSRSSWAACSPAQASAMIRRGRRAGMRSPLRISVRCSAHSGSPSTYSMTRYVMPSCSPTSRICATFGCSMRDAMRLSSMNIFWNRASDANCGRIVFIATSFSKPWPPVSRRDPHAGHAPLRDRADELVAIELLARNEGRRRMSGMLTRGKYHAQRGAERDQRCPKFALRAADPPRWARRRPTPSTGAPVRRSETM